MIPASLDELLEDFSFISDRNERVAWLIDAADRFDEARVPPDVAAPPYDEAHRVPACESDAFVWALPTDGGVLDFRFDVLNPQGLSAMALAVILYDCCSGAPLQQVAAIPQDIVLKIFGREVSMGKGQGLMGLVTMVTHAAREELGSQSAGA
ncbi:MAG: SufE family protein [Anaerolineaceae bacterium]|nr:SufE family protein [Anaerolineaceae bacterium]MCY3907659.1 SufE family protein [Anaerolineaceae bacterium]